MPTSSEAEIPSELQIIEIRFLTARGGKDLKRNLAHRDAMGSMILLVYGEDVGKKTQGNGIGT
jgi:hypothetical protein